MTKTLVARIRDEITDAKTAWDMGEWAYMLPTPLFRVYVALTRR